MVERGVKARAALAALVLALLAVPSTAGAREHFYYLDPSQIDLTVLLPPPPDVASAQARADEQQVATAVARAYPFGSISSRGSLRAYGIFLHAVGRAPDSRRSAFR